MVGESAEEYLAAVYRLRESRSVPVRLSKLGSYFGFSPVSIHEMIQKLDQQAFVEYHPYRGVMLTEAGEAIARSLLRRHRLWERFLTDMLELPWDEAHDVAEHLEHAAPESVTERLACLLGDPDHCPHGSPIPPFNEGDEATGWCLAEVSEGDWCTIVRISPESQELLHQLRLAGIGLGSNFRVIRRCDQSLVVEIEGQEIHLPGNLIQSIWVTSKKFDEEER